MIVRVGWDFQEEEYTDMFPQVEYRVNPEMAEVHAQFVLKKRFTQIYLKLEVKCRYWQFVTEHNIWLIHRAEK